MKGTWKLLLTESIPLTQSLLHLTPRMWPSCPLHLLFILLLLLLPLFLFPHFWIPPKVLLPILLPTLILCSPCPPILWDRITLLSLYFMLQLHHPPILYPFLTPFTGQPLSIPTKRSLVSLQVLFPTCTLQSFPLSLHLCHTPLILLVEDILFPPELPWVAPGVQFPGVRPETGPGVILTIPSVVGNPDPPFLKLPHLTAPFSFPYLHPGPILLATFIPIPPWI